MKVLKEKGITLLSLIVTVIILLILVGVTIGQITGNKGLFNRVRKTVAQYENSQEQEDAGMLELETMLAEERENSKELEEPTANPGDVLMGRSYYDKNKEPQEGTMPNQGSLNRTVPESGKLELNAGYYSGGTITANKPQYWQYGGGSLVAELLTCCSDYNSPSSHFALFTSTTSAGYEDCCFCNEDYVSVINAAGGAFYYNGSQSTITLKQNKKYTLFVTVAPYRQYSSGGYLISKMTLTDGTKTYFETSYVRNCNIKKSRNSRTSEWNIFINSSSSCYD